MSKALRSPWRWAACLSLALMLVGCATPTYITNASSSKTNAKFVYQKVQWLSVEEGTIKCDVAASGELENCKKMVIKVDGKNYQEK